MLTIKMKRLIIALLSLVAFQTALAEKPSSNWMTFYYKNPTPDKFVEEVRSLTKAGMLKDENAQAPILAFLSQVMAANHKKIPDWLEAFSDLDKDQSRVLLAAAWYSDTDEARAYLEKHKVDDFLKSKAPKILEMDVTNPSILDMLWGYFTATGSEEPIRRIVSAFSLSKYSGAIGRYKTSEKTEQDKKEAYMEATFQAAQWSLEANGRQHALVLKHCETIFADPNLPKDQSLWLAVILSKLKPEKYGIDIDKNKGEQEGEDKHK